MKFVTKNEKIETAKNEIKRVESSIASAERLISQGYMNWAATLPGQKANLACFEQELANAIKNG